MKTHLTRLILSQTFALFALSVSAQTTQEMVAITRGSSAADVQKNFDVLNARIAKLAAENATLTKRLTEIETTATATAGVTVEVVDAWVYVGSQGQDIPDENTYRAPTTAWSDVKVLKLPDKLKDRKLLAVWATFGGNGVQNIKYLRQVSVGLTPTRKNITFWLLQTGENPEIADKIQVQIHVLTGP